MPPCVEARRELAPANFQLHKARPAILGYGLAVGSVSLAFAIALLLERFRGMEFPLFLFAIALSVLCAGVGLATLAVLLSILTDGISLPTVHRAVELAVDRQIGPCVGILRRKSFINIHAETWRVTGMHQSIRKAVRMRENSVGFFKVVHVFLNAEIVNAQIEMQRGRHAYWTHVGGAVAPRSHVIKFCQAGDFLQMGNPPRMHDRGSNVVDELLLNQQLAIVNRVENLTHRQGNRGVLADKAKALLQLRRNGIFEPE